MANRVDRPAHDRQRPAIPRKAEPLGTHAIRFRPTVDGFAVDTEVEMAVRVLFPTLFRYRNEAAEQWRDGPPCRL